MPSRPDLHTAMGYSPAVDLKALSDSEREIIEAAEPHTMTGLIKLHALVIAVRHVIDAEIPGSFAECGVWRGGSVQAIAATLQERGVNDRDLYLFDTFAGMTMPDDRDTSPVDGAAVDLWVDAMRSGQRMFAEDFAPEFVNESAVRSVVLSAGYPESRVHTVRGPVEETLPSHAPERLALLRLDTDWYQSTLHELEQLYPRLSPGGVLIVDDYGHWDGARQAVEDYFTRHGGRPLLSRVDYSCRLAVKL